MAIISTGSFAKALWPGVNSWYGKAYAEHPVEWSGLFTSYSSKRAFEEDISVTSFGYASIKVEGGSIGFDSERQGFITRYNHTVYALGFVITREMVEDDLYAVAGEKKAKGLAFSMRQTKEVNGANVYNRAFNSLYTGGDGKSLLNSGHLNVAGGTWSNVLSTAADLSETGLEQACIDISGWKNDRGLQIAVMPQKLLISKEQVFEAERILKTPYRPSTADNDINALYTMGKFPGGVEMNHYFTDVDAWFLLTNSPDGMKHWQRRPLQFSIDNDFDTDNAKFKAHERYTFGWTDPRALFGSAGA